MTALLTGGQSIPCRSDSVQRRDRLPIRSDAAPSRPRAVFDQRSHHITHDGGERQSIDSIPAGAWRSRGEAAGPAPCGAITEIQRGFPGIALQRYSRQVHREIEATTETPPLTSPVCGHRDARNETPARPVNLAGEGASVRQCQKAGKTR